MFCFFIECYINVTYVLQSSKPGTVLALVKKSHCNNSQIATNAYKVHAKLNAAIIIVTIPVSLLCLFATIFAILPVDLIVCYNNILYFNIGLA